MVTPRVDTAVTVVPLFRLPLASRGAVPKTRIRRQLKKANSTKPAKVVLSRAWLGEL